MEEIMSRQWPGELSGSLTKLSQMLGRYKFKESHEMLLEIISSLP
jgi:hypothetical protein